MGFSPFSHARASAYPRARATARPVRSCGHDLAPDRARPAGAGPPDVPPDAPTLCEGWQARHLAAHVVLRERSAWSGRGSPSRPSSAAPSARSRGSPTRRRPRAPTATSWRGSRTSPRAWHPPAWAGEAANLVEFFVHTEDVRRGAGPVRARELDPALVDALWSQLPRAARDGCATAPSASCSSAPTGSGTSCARRRRDYGTVVVRGDVGELVLYLRARRRGRRPGGGRRPTTSRRSRRCCPRASRPPARGARWPGCRPRRRRSVRPAPRSR